MYDLDALAAFAAVMRHGSLSAGARELGLAKSTVSRRLQRLEQGIGQPLLRRDGNRMIPTEAGHMFETYCQRMLELARASRESLDELRQEVSGALVLHVHDALAGDWLHAELECFLARHRGVRVSLRSREPPDTAGRDVTCIWLGAAAPDHRLRREVLGHLSRGMFAHPDYLKARGAPTHPRDLARHAWLDLLGEADQGLTLTHQSDGGFRLPPCGSRMRVDRLVLQMDAIARGDGLGLLPHWIARARARRRPGTLVACLPGWEAPALPVMLLYPHGHLPRRTRALLDHLRAAIPAAWSAAPDAAGGEPSAAASGAGGGRE